MWYSLFNDILLPNDQADRLLKMIVIKNPYTCLKSFEVLKSTKNVAAHKTSAHAHKQKYIFPTKFFHYV